jgi:integrase
MGCYREGRVWRYEFQFQGQRYTRSGFKTKGEAVATREAHRKEVKTQTPTDTGSEPSFRDVANEYLDYSQRRFSEKNYKGKIYVYRQFRDFSGNPPFNTIGPRIVEKYLGTLPRNSNFNRHRKALCSLFSWAFKRKLLEVNPCIYIDGMPHQPAGRRIPTQEEMAKIILAAGEQRTFFLALFSLAGRLGEINNLRWEDVNFEKRQVTLWTRKGDGTPRAQVKHLNPDLYRELKLLWDRKAGTWVFPNPKTGEPYRNRRKQIQNACSLAGVPYYSWHCIRHHVASLLADTHKESLPTIQKMLGHQNVTTTARYVQSLSQDVVEAAEKLKVTQLAHTN